MTIRALSLIGFMGSGKTTIGARVGELAGLQFFDLDHLIESTRGLTVAEIFDREGEPAFRRLEADLLPAVLQPGVVAALGGGAPLADANWELIRRRSFCVHLALPFERVWERLEREAPTRPLLAGRTPAEIRELFEARLARYTQAQTEVDADRPIEIVARDVLELLVHALSW